MSLDLQQLAVWMDRYVAAWASNDRQRIADLFAPDALYYAHPYDEPLHGGEAIADAWLENPDPEGTWAADYQPLLVAGDVGVATGTSTYFREKSGEVEHVFYNIFVLTFDDAGRCAAYREWYMREPKRER
jgi:ketosteroid isomerase-like protein